MNIFKEDEEIYDNEIVRVKVNIHENDMVEIKIGVRDSVDEIKKNKINKMTYDITTIMLDDYFDIGMLIAGQMTNSPIFVLCYNEFKKPELICPYSKMLLAIPTVGDAMNRIVDIFFDRGIVSKEEIAALVKDFDKNVIDMFKRNLN